MQQPALVSIPSKSQLIATNSCLKAPRVPHMNDLTMSGHLEPGQLGTGRGVALRPRGAPEQLQTRGRAAGRSLR